ncbi:MAG: alkaline phosphatase family protein [Anaerolineae bacterium]
MARKILIICIDGLGPEYLQAAPTPNLGRMAREGVAATVRTVIPSVTNVNNVSIITGVPPAMHGITSNYWLDKQTGEERLMESPEYLCWPTILQRSQGLSTALFTAKEKLLHLLDAGADYSLAAENPDGEMVRRLGPPPGIYSPGINPWLFRALRIVLRELDPDIAYCSTTDGMMHKYPPEAEESIAHIQQLDQVLGEIVDDNPEREIYLTADHGMSAKSRGIDLERVLQAQGVAARAIPIIKDRYVLHHQNLGGASYIYLEDSKQMGWALSVLLETLGVEAVYTQAEAAREFQLMAERIGDIFVLADQETVFGSFEAASVLVNVRSHGSRHEGTVPLIAYGGQAREYKRNFDIVAQL